jgi:uncharacterized RDD family membrane protein YckC
VVATLAGQTLGKKVPGVRVVNVDGRPIGFGRAFVTLHDLGAGTLVVDS